MTGALYWTGREDGVDTWGEDSPLETKEGDMELIFPPWPSGKINPVSTFLDFQPLEL